MRNDRESQPKKPRVPWKQRMEQVKVLYGKAEKSTRAFARRVVPRPYDDEKTRLFKTISWAIIGMAFLMVFLAVSVFFLALRGEEETLVPQVVGKDLTSALVELQEKELQGYIQVKFSEDPRDKGNVVAQDPQGGIVSKSGRRVTLWVSKGAVIDNMENFVGQNINDVQLRLKTLFSSQAQPLLYLTANPVYTFNTAPEGTVLEQKPVAGTALSSPTELVVVVSKGPKGQTVKVGTYTDRLCTESLAAVMGENKPFVIHVRKAEAGEKPGQVVNQSPGPGTEMPKGTPVNLTMTQPLPLTDGRTFQIVETTLPDYPILVDVKVVLTKAAGDESTLFQLRHPGGLLTVPFLGAAGDVLHVFVLDKEVFTLKVGDPKTNP